MADPVGILGLTGTAEQVVKLTKFLYDSHKALKENIPAVEELKSTYETMQSMLDRLSLASFHGANPSHVQATKHEMDAVKTLISDAQDEVERQLQRAKSKNRISQHISALKDKTEIEKLATDAKNILQRIMDLSRDENLNSRLNAISRSSGDVFLRTVWTTKNPPSVCVSLDCKDEDGQPDTYESKLKSLVIRSGPETHVGAVALGQGGVGKTCTLRAIANDNDVDKCFPGGIYFLSLGKDASIGTIIEQLCTAVRVSGGANKATRLQTEENFANVVAEVHGWFKGHATLFIFDDVWARNGIDVKVLHTLTGLVGNVSGDRSRNSKILYSTRDERLSSPGLTVKFEPRDHQGARALEILLKVADDSTAWRDPECKVHVQTILDKCAGLPLALNVAGSAVGQMRKRWKGRTKEAWKSYAARLNEPRHLEQAKPDDSYDYSLDAMLRSSLEILDEEERDREMNFQEMHRTLCVLRKQDWIPLPILQHLWGIDDEFTTVGIVRQMEDVGVAELQSGMEGLRLHDLTHDFARREAENYNEVKKWHTKLLDKYRTEDGSIAHSMLSSVTEDERRFVFENIYRIYREAGLYDEVCRLVQSARWVSSALRNRKFWQLEQAVQDYLDQAVDNGEATPQQETSLHEDRAFGMRMIARAVHLSVLYLDGNMSNIYFQLYARLMDVSPKSVFVSTFLKDVESCAPRPWLKPITACLTGAVTAILESIHVGFVVDTVKFSNDDVTGTGKHYTNMVYAFKHNRSEGMNEITALDVDALPAAPTRAQKTVKKFLPCLTDTAKCYPRCLRRIIGKRFRVLCSDVYEDYVAVGCSDGTIRIARLGSNVVERTIQGHTRKVSSVCFSADGERVASGSSDKTVRVWDVATGDAMCDTLTGHKNAVKCIAMSADGRRVVSGSWDNTVRVWDVAAGECLLVAEAYEWDDIVSQYCGTNAEHGATSSEEGREQYYKKDNSVALRCGDRPEEILAQFESTIYSFQVDTRKGVVIAGLRNGVVAILRIIK